MLRLLTNKTTFIRNKGILSVTINVNHFDILDISKNYNINKNNLDLNYKNIKKVFCLENFDQTNLISYINEAYLTLKDDYKRCLYMLLLEGVEIEDNEQLKNSKHIEELFELNEKIDEGTYKLMALKEEIKDKIEEIKYDFNEAMENKDLDKAKEKCILLSYYMNADNAIYEKINEL